MHYNSEYVEKNLIAYIGNKRRLLNLIINAVKKTGVLDSEKNNQENIRFLDLFAGTGVVSRLARSLGFEVTTNDWEYYSYIINKAFLELDADFLQNAFEQLGGIRGALETLNALEKPAREDEYISKFYCPENDKNPDLVNERLFYTSYNGNKIDAIRAKIAEWKDKSVINEKEENILLALLLYEASTRSNTSGVFKGFHKGFGGTNGDALGRILKPLTLAKPELINGKPCKVVRNDAVKLSEELQDNTFDIVYLDPPYNQHQYGSNYHLLNTIALNDKPLVNKDVFICGKKINKSAIRKDWVNTKSSFCYKKSAEDDFKKIISNLNTRYILLSYSTDGIIAFDSLLKILAEKGKVEIVLSEYTKYRGGKQALTTEVKNIEFILMIDTARKGSIEDIIHIQKILLTTKTGLLMKKTINPLKAERLGFIYKNKLGIDTYKVEKVLHKIYDNNCIEYCFNKNKLHNNEHVLNTIKSLSLDTLQKVHDELEFITNLTKEDEIYLQLGEIKKAYIEGKYDECFEIYSGIPYLLSKFNNKKAYIQSLKALVSILNTLEETLPVWTGIKLQNIKSFHKLETIMLLKLNNIDHDTKEQVKQIKSTISSSYERLLYKLESYEHTAPAEQKVKTGVY